MDVMEYRTTPRQTVDLLKKALVPVHNKMSSRIGKDTIQDVYQATGFDPSKL